MDGPHDPRPPAAVPASPLAVARAVVDVLAGRSGRRAALATVIARSGSAPQVVGARVLVLDDGTTLGTVGGGAVEAWVLRACQQVLREGAPQRLSCHLVRDLGMCCGGTMEFFVEHLEPTARLVIVGAGHVAQALAPMARTAGWEVAVVDDREELLDHPAFAGCRVHGADVDEITAALPDLHAGDHVLIVTRDHARDERALAALLGRPLAYLGMIGSRRKVHTVLRRVLDRRRALELPPPELAHVRAPVGLDLGGRTPGEIAVSILAELVAVRHGRGAAPLSRVHEVPTEP